MTNSQKAAEKVQKHLREMYGDDLIEIAEDVGDIATIIDTELAAEREANKKLREAVTELITAMERYEMAVDDLPPYEHREMMNRARSALAEHKEGM